MEKILAVDDDLNLLKLMKMRLEAEGFHVLTATAAEQALKIASANPVDIAVVDLKLQRGEDGIALMQELHQRHPRLPIIILTAFGTIKSAVEAMSKGAYTYLTKPFDHKELLLQINTSLEKNRLLREVKRLRGLVKERYGFENIVAKSESMDKVLAQVSLVAENDSVVYIEGESGTGKELIAKALHLAGPRSEGPFVAINCAAIPEALLESELFGYERGAFTGALRAKKGLFFQAHQGTLFLDEISEMPVSMQSKLLRVLEEREVHPLGADRPVRVEARIIAASNKTLEEEVAEGRFREDLFYRIHIIPIRLPPLRERKEDIPLLANHFLETCAQKMKKDIKGFESPAMQKLISHSWPGNVRELKNVIEYAVTMTQKNVITEELITPREGPEGESPKPFREAKDDFERSYLIELIRLTQGNVSQAAKLAGKYRADLYELLKKHNLDPADYRMN